MNRLWAHEGSSTAEEVQAGPKVVVMDMAAEVEGEGFKDDQKGL